MPSLFAFPSSQHPARQIICKEEEEKQEAAKYREDAEEVPQGKASAAGDVQR